MKAHNSNYAEVWIASNSCFDDFKIQSIERTNGEIIIEVRDEIDIESRQIIKDVIMI